MIRRCFLFVFLAAPAPLRLAAAPVEVKFGEGNVHGFLLVESASGENVGQGDMLQTIDGGLVDSRLNLRFKDGSRHEERAVYTQQGVFVLQSYRLVQGGPSFPGTVDVSLDRKTGTYKARLSKDGKTQESEGPIELPADLYNGMVPTLLKNFARGAGATVQMVVFVPKPRFVALEMSPADAQPVKVGELTLQATRYALKPKLGAAIRMIAIVMGVAPADQECVILNEDVPAFVRCDGPLYLKGPVWRIEQTAPR